MHLSRWLLLLLSLALALPAQASRLALVIGNAAYVDSPLKNPVNDARAMEARLRSLGFAVEKVENLRRDQIGRTINAFANRIKPGDEVVVFYAGHGVQVKGVNYLPAVDAQIQSEADVPLNSLNLNALLDLLDEAKAGVKIMLLDACRNNPFARSFRSSSRGLARVADAPSGTLMHFATKPGRVAADGAGANGLYTSQLLQWIDKPGLPVEQMFKRVALGVRQASQGEQEPWVEGSLLGDFYFRPGSTSAVANGAAQPAPAGLNLEDLQGQAERERAEQAALARMQMDFDTVAAFSGTAALQVTAWQRFLAAWSDDKLPGEAGRGLKAQAQQRLVQAREAARQPVQVAQGGAGSKACPECPETMLLQPGSFRMGSPDSEDGRSKYEGPLHTVNIGYKLAVGKTHVTKGEFSAFVSATGYRTEAEQGDGCYGWTGTTWEKRTNFNWRNVGFEQSSDHPVVCVSWNDTQRYIGWLNEKSPVKGWRLLSEAEWEFAARAGTSSPYYWGQQASHENANYGKDSCCGPLVQGRDRWEFTSPVGQFPANPWGLLDMAGNAWQWTQDCYESSYSSTPTDGSAANASSCTWRVLRGGSWGGYSQRLRSANRNGYSPNDRDDGIGFRLARTVF